VALSAYVFIFDDTPATPKLEQHIIDFKVWSAAQLLTASGASVWERSKDSGWVTCDLVLPEVALTASITNDMGASHTFRFFGVIEYDWITASPAQIAATNLAWGRDPQDFDREVAA